MRFLFTMSYNNMSNGQNRVHPKARWPNRVPPSTLVPGRHLIGQRPSRPDSSRISNGSTRFWLLTPPAATRFQSHLPDYGRAIRPAAHTRTRTRRRVIASSRDAAGHFCGRRGRACGRTLTLLCSLHVMWGIFLGTLRSHTHSPPSPL